MSISAKEVKSVANLARIKLSSLEVTKFQTDLSEIIDYNAKQLSKIRKSLPSNLSASPNLGEDDQVRVSLSQELALSNAPQSKNGFIVVPKVLGEK